MLENSFHKKESPIQGMMGMGGGATGLLYGTASGGSFGLDNFPTPYQTLINSYASQGYQMIYVDKQTGDDNNSGNSFAAAKQNYFSVFTNNGQGIGSSPTRCIVVRGHHAVDWNTSNSQLGVIDGGSTAYKVIGAPGQTLLRVRNSGSGRDHHVVASQTTSTEAWGLIMEKVKDSSRSTNYMTAFFAPESKGRFYNCVFRSVSPTNVLTDPDTTPGARTQANAQASMHYDNPNNINTDTYDSVIICDPAVSNYTGGSSCDFFYCRANNGIVTAGTWQNSYTNESIQSDYSGSGNSGVYRTGSTYKWVSSLFNDRYSYGNPYE